MHTLQGKLARAQAALDILNYLLDLKPLIQKVQTLFPAWLNVTSLWRLAIHKWL